jgi:Papain-like cysteine protease AvrRpt2
MKLSDYIHATTQPYSSLQRKLELDHLWWLTRSLAFNMQAQTQSNWCWAATSTSVSHFYWWASPWTQCKVAGAELNLTTCCQSPVPSACNVPWYLDKALARTQNFVSIVSGTVSFDQVKAEIDAGRPVGARIGWSGGGGHFVAIYGYTQILGVLDFFDIDDPIYGKSHLSVSDFTSNYQGSGTWTHTYFTKSYIGIMILNPLPLADEVLQHIWEARPLLGVKAGLPPAEIKSIADRTLGLAHPIFTLGLNELMAERALPAQTGVRVVEFSAERPQAFYDLADAQTGNVQQMSATSPYLELLPRALAAVSAQAGGDTRFDLRLLRVPALNFEALWLHAGDGAADQVIPLRAFHGFTEFHAIPYREAIDKLRNAAQSISQQDDTMGA